MAETSAEDKILEISTEKVDNYTLVKIKDHGCGIPPENLTRIFNHGFTTKKAGHGFGIHSCATMMMEMGGKLTVESEGVGKGATFILKIPTQDLVKKNEKAA